MALGFRYEFLDKKLHVIRKFKSMKRFSFIQLLVILFAAVTLVSCGMSQPLYEDEYDRPMSRRQVYADPYFYGNAPMLVRDPYSGRYYEVVPVGPGAYGSPYGYGAGYGYGRANGNYGRGGYYNGGSNTGRNTPVRRNDGGEKPSSGGSSEKIQRAKDVINGK